MFNWVEADRGARVMKMVIKHEQGEEEEVRKEMVDNWSRMAWKLDQEEEFKKVIKITKFLNVTSEIKHLGR